MKINVVMPQLGESIVEGQVVRWLKRAGDPVQRDEALVEVKTDKATVEIPAPATGTLSEILVQEGGSVAVGAGIASLETTSESAALAVEGASTAARRVEPPVVRPQPPPEREVKKPPQPEPKAEKAEPEKPPQPEPEVKQPPQPEPAPEKTKKEKPEKEKEEKPAPKPARAPERKPQPPPPQPPPSQPPAAGRVGKPRITPLARRVAADLGVDPSKIAGTGEGGRITREDILRARPGKIQTAQAPQQAPAQSAEAETEPVAQPSKPQQPKPPQQAPAQSAEPETQPAAQPSRPQQPESPQQAPAQSAEAETQPAARPEKIEKSPATPSAEPPGPGDEAEILPLSPIRRRIAARLAESSRAIPRVTTAIEADLTPVAELRKNHRESFEKAGLKLTFLPFIMKAAVDALKEFPAVNASWGGDNLILHRRVHLGIAVSVEGGLVVPVIRQADSISLRRLAQRLAEVADHARAGKLAADEVQGGTFTITNPGLFGAVFSTPIINPPEAAILAVCRIAETPVVRDGRIALRSITHLCLSYDHRIIDGETAIRFLQRIRAALEEAKFDMA